MRKPLKIWLTALAAVALVAAVGGVSSAGADDYPKVVLIEGASNKTCEELSSYGAAGASWQELKFDSGNLPSVGNSSTGANSYLSVTLTRTDTDTWSWTSTKGVDAVLVKSGASGHNLYVYDPPTEATSGSGLTVPGQNGTSHVSFCYDEDQAPPPSHETGTLKVVKVIENGHGVGFGDFSHSVDSGAAVQFDADGVSEYTFDAGTSHDVTEPEANGEGYTTTYSADCTDGVIVANQTITCTITNTFGHDEEEPSDLTIEKTAAGQFDVRHDWTIDKQVKLAGASDATYGDNAVLNLPDGGAGSVTWKVVVGHTTVETNFKVTGTIHVGNPSDSAVSGVSVSDPGGVVDCDPAAGVQSTGLVIPADGFLTCTYTATPASKIPTNTATVSWGAHKSASATAHIAWSKGEDIGLPATVDDSGAIDHLEIAEATTKTYDERWTCANGTASPHSGRTNTATVTWHGGSASDSASVQVGCGQTPPPPPPPPPPPSVTSDEFMDVQVIKDATPQVQLVNGQADIAYTVRIRNNGPNQAHNVQLVDAAPSGVTFLAITVQPAAGSCSITPALLSCSFGTLGPGVEQTIGISARVTQTGTYVNSATGTGQGKDTNGANNTDDASTLVTAPALPPTATPKPKPKPKPEPEVCRVLRVTPGMVKANGKRQVVLAKVTQRKNPRAGVAVTFSGAGVTKVVRTDKSGVARLGVKPGRAGIVLVKITSAKACNSARIGVVGVFEPPVTG